MTLDRRTILENAITHTCGDRDVEYGPPDQNFANIALLWTDYIGAKYGAEFALTPEDVAWLNVLQKMARHFHGARKADTYEDAAAFAAIAGEVSK